MTRPLLPHGLTTYRLEPRGSRWQVLAERPSLSVPLRLFGTRQEADLYLSECRDRTAWLRAGMPALDKPTPLT